MRNTIITAGAFIVGVLWGRGYMLAGCVVVAALVLATASGMLDGEEEACEEHHGDE